jgi:hypothetical protein
MLQKGFSIGREEIQDLTNPQKLLDFFSHLGYNGSTRRLLEQDARGAFRADEIGRFHPYGSLSEQVQGFFTLGERMDREYARPFFVLLYVVSSVNAEVRKEIFQDLLNVGGEFLFVLTDPNFRTLELSYLDREAQAMQGQLLAGELGAAPARRTGRAAREPARLRSYAFEPRNLRWPDARSERVTLRVLKNLDWPAERDIFAQCRRLKGAFDLADWSEEFFNNHSLFSDHFLLDLKEDEAQVWQATTQPGPEQRAFDEAFRELRRLYEDAREELRGRPVEECRRKLIEPVLSRLGFLSAPIKGAAGRPHDYELSLPDPHGLPTGRVAILLAYAWGRDLDGYESEDPARQTPVDRPDENPGAMVVARLEETGAEWAMLTNGQIWRLYSTRAYSRATNYYEIDLAETLSLPLSTADEVAEAKDALRYFWLIFRARAFLSMHYAGGDSPQTFLEYLLQRGQERALKLGNDLKDRVFKQIFPHLAQGFILHAQQQGLLRLDTLSEQERADELARYFEGTLGLLFRLLFVLYAESRNLLPLRDRAAYYPHSLAALKDEIAARTRREPNRSIDPRQSVREETDEKIRRVYSPESYALYEHLLKLFRAIDQGDPALNLPIYDGGLFMSMTEQEAREEEQRLAADAEARARDPLDQRMARFLTLHRVPDQYLALGLDALARDIQPKPPHLLMMIDYKSLGVRQLGSIYEGLLEFKLRVATVPMAVVRGKQKGSEEFMPYDEALASGRVLVRKGPRKNDEPLVYQPGTAYIENDRRERKATGSYYTPDYIVQYIIEQTVGPVLDAHKERFLPRFRSLEQAYVQKKRQRQALNDAPEKIFFNQFSLKLVDEFFEISVLDPAMGSGHFLVAAVDYITDRLLRFLKGVPHNPVRYMLERTREEIAREMERQRIQVDTSSLTEVNLLKRQVLKRCIYGVDLNPMAVLLARVSVWLDSFTRGAPLSFLDHHLKWGNSLLGARVDEVQAWMIGDGEATQLGLFEDTSWTEMIVNAAGLIRVSKLGDNTPEQARESQEKFARASVKIEPYKKYLNLYMSRWYSNPYTVRKRENTVYDPALILMRSPKFKRWLLENEPFEFPDNDRELFENAQRDAREHRFFHWELEFPDVFVEPNGSVLKKNAGFHAVIGNPPYVRQEGLGRDKRAFEDTYTVYDSIADLYTYFIEQGHRLLLNKDDVPARFGMITANKFMRANYGAKLRSFLTTQTRLEQLIDFGELRVFDEAAIDPMITIFSRNTPASFVSYTQVKSLNFNNLDKVVKALAITLPDKALQGDSWSLARDEQQAVLDKLKNTGIPLGEFTSGQIRRGILTGYNDAFFIDRATRDRLIAEDPKSAEIIKPLLIGDDIRRYSYEFREQFLIFTRRGIDITKYRAIERHLMQYKMQLEPKPANWDEQKQGKWPGRKPGPYKWYEIQDNVAYFEDFEKPKIMYPEIAMVSRFTLDTDGFYTNNKVFLIPENDYYLLSLLNSELIWFFLKKICSVLGDAEEGGRLELRAIHVEKVPIRRIAFTTPDEQREGSVEALMEVYGDYLGARREDEREVTARALLERVKLHLGREPEEADVVHDLLAKLARAMLDLNSEKRVGQQRFIEEFETILDIRGRRYRNGRVGLEAWQNRERIKNFAGDYQKDEGPLSEDELIAIIKKNRPQWAASFTPERERRVREAYARALPDALRLKDRLAATDRLIDRVVYALYGLTDEEIALVEGG